MKILKTIALLAAANVLAACASMKNGSGDAQGVVVEASGSAAAEGFAAQISSRALAAAKRAAVDSLIDLFISSRTRQLSGVELEHDVLSRAPEFVLSYKELESRREGAFLIERIRARVAYPKLGAALDRLGLVNREAIEGQPRVLLSIKERGPGALADAGRVSQAMRRALVVRGYAAVDLSDRVLSQFSALGERVPSEEAARTLGASVLVVAEASTTARERPGLSDFSAYEASVAVHWEAMFAPPREQDFEQTAEAIDRSAEGAAAQALENAGALAGERIAEALSARWKTHAEVSVLIVGVSGLSEIRRYIEELRRVPEVAGVSLATLAEDRAGLKLFSRHGADDVSAALLRASNFGLRVVVVDANYVEMETAAGAGFSD